jgi:8-oxo-dGTP diphosphatase
MTPIPVKHVVTCFLLCAEQILILQRSDKVASFRGRWASVSGFIETNPDEQGLTEIREETGLGQREVHLLKKGHTLSAEDGGVRWVVHPYLYEIQDKSRIRIDWEHSDLRWIDPNDLALYQTVPKLKEALTLVYPL